MSPVTSSESPQQLLETAVAPPGGQLGEHGAVAAPDRQTLPPGRENVRGTVYLLHFSHRYLGALHYIGWTEGPLHVRMRAHKMGQGSRLMAAVTNAGLDFTVANTWEGTRELERKLKNQKNAARICPICREGNGHER
jgi:hypothetical protein